MMEGGFYFGPKLYSSDEMSLNGGLDSSRDDDDGDEHDAISIRSIKQHGDMAPHVAYHLEMERRSKNIFEVELAKAHHGMTEMRLANALEELEEATKQATRMTRCLQSSRMGTVDKLLELESRFNCVEAPLLADKSEIEERYTEQMVECAQELDKARTTLNHARDRIMAGNALVDTSESIRGALFELNLHTNELHEIARHYKENVSRKNSVEAELNWLTESQLQLTAMLQAPGGTQFETSVWNYDVITRTLVNMTNLERRMTQIRDIAMAIPEVDASVRSVDEFVIALNTTRDAIHRFELTLNERNPQDEVKYLVSPGTTGSYSFVESLGLPPHLEYSSDSTGISSFVSASEAALPVHLAQPLETVSSSARVEITESETRPLFVATTVTDDKSFVNPVPQSPLCPTANEMASVTTARTIASQPKLNTTDFNPSDCTTATEIHTVDIATKDNEERVVEPNDDLVTAIEAHAPEVQAAIGTQGYDDLLSLLTARCLSEEDVRTALTQSLTDIRTARSQEEANSPYKLSSLLSCRANSARRKPTSFSWIPTVLKWTRAIWKWGQDDGDKG